MKWIKTGCGLTILVGIVMIGLGWAYLNWVCRWAVTTWASKRLGAKITLSKAEVSVLKGKLRLEQFVLGNTEGFDTDHAMQFDVLELDIRLRSIFSNPVVIERIYIGGPVITLEQSLTGSNLGRLGEILAPDKREKAAPAAVTKPKRKRRTLCIDELLIENPRLRLTVTGARGLAVTLSMSSVHLYDIGKSDHGLSADEVMKTILDELTEAATKAAGTASSQQSALGAGLKWLLGAAEQPKEKSRPASGLTNGSAKANGGSAGQTQNPGLGD